METKLNDRNKRALIILAAAMAAILAFNYIYPAWEELQVNLANEKEAKKERDGGAESEKRAKELAEIVPFFEMPQAEDVQRLLFERKYNEQLQKAGIKLTLLPEYQARGKLVKGIGVRPLRMKCLGKGKFNNVLDLFAKLNENPYLVGIEEITIKCNPSNRQEMEMDLTVSTYVQ